MAGDELHTPQRARAPRLLRVNAGPIRSALRYRNSRRWRSRPRDCNLYSPAQPFPLRFILLDSSAKPGAKILVSGGSRCNVTNVAVSERDFYGGKPAIIRRVLKAFPPDAVIAWFASLGVPLHEEAHGKLFPDSNRSRDVLKAMLEETAAAGVEFQAATRVNDITSGGAFTLHTTRGRVRATRRRDGDWRTVASEDGQRWRRAGNRLPPWSHDRSHHSGARAADVLRRHPTASGPHRRVTPGGTGTLD